NHSSDRIPEQNASGAQLRSRIVNPFSGLVVLWGILILRAVVLQVLPNERLEALKSRQFQTVVTLQSRRGAIVDRLRRDLALSTGFAEYLSQLQRWKKTFCLAGKTCR